MAIAGRCHCGAVRYAIEADAMPASYACHCTDCQTQSGSAFTLQMPLFADRLHVTGELTSGTRRQPSGEDAVIFACARCLTRLYSENPKRPGIVILRAGTLDDSRSLHPKAHFFVTSKLDWVTIPADAIALETQPQTGEAFLKLMELETRA